MHAVITSTYNEKELCRIYMVEIVSRDGVTIDYKWLDTVQECIAYAEERNITDIRVC